jgi:protein TBF1
MAGLDMVKGPHWSQILGLFGAHGTVSDILKDRTQVQLKDKARNLKLFFLKAGSEMPYYLSSVTGELKTRAPMQAARKEAEEKARLHSEEQQAHVQGILTLAGGLQNLPPQQKPVAGPRPGQIPGTTANQGQMAPPPRPHVSPAAVMHGSQPQATAIHPQQPAVPGSGAVETHSPASSPVNQPPNSTPAHNASDAALLQRLQAAVAEPVTSA